MFEHISVLGKVRLIILKYPLGESPSSLLVVRHFGMKDLIHALLFLLYEPNFDDPYNMYCNNLPMPVEKYIRHTLAGGTVNSVKFPPNEAWCQWATENGILPLTDETVQPTPEVSFLRIIGLLF